MRVRGRWALGDWAEGEGCVLVVEGISICESCLVLALHVVPLHVSLAESLRVISAFRGAECSAGECKQECSREHMSH